jgi:hypothetical protein
MDVDWYGIILKEIIYTRISALVRFSSLLLSACRIHVCPDEKEHVRARFIVEDRQFLHQISHVIPHQLQACFNVETPSLLIFEPLAPARLSVTGLSTVNNSHISADIRVVPTNAHANRVFAWSFSPRCSNRSFSLCIKMYIGNLRYHFINILSCIVFCTILCMY